MVYVIIWIVCAVLGGMVGSSKGRGGAGVALGLLLGPIGVLIVAFLPANTAKAEEKALSEGGMRKCPFCAELVKAEAVVCKHCGKDLPPIEKPVEAAPEGNWTCKKCGNSNEPKYMVCQSCGSPKD